MLGIISLVFTGANDAAVAPDHTYEKTPGEFPGVFSYKGGVHLLSRLRSTIGRGGLTSVFGMGTGVARSVKTPPQVR